MKRIINICLLLLLAFTATAQTPQKHRLRVSVKPEHFSVTTVSFNDEGKQHAQRNDTIDIDMMVPAGTRIYVHNNWQSASYGSFIPMHLLENDKEVPFLDSNGQVINGSTSTYNYYFYYYMPDYDVDLVAIYEYKQSTPTDQINYNGWYPETGTLVMDYNNYTTPANFNYSEDREKVLRYIVAYSGVESFNITDKATDYPNVILKDYSRTTATRFARHSSFDDEIWRERLKNLTEIVLPSTIKTIDSPATLSSNLQILTCYAMVPPSFTMYDVFNYETNQYEPFLPFQNTPDIVIRVPADALPFYQSAEYWKDMTIVPMDENNVTLTVNIMATANAGVLAQYKGMHLQLTNRQTGMTRSLLVGARNSYEFNYLPTNTAYDLALLNNTGSVVASIENIFMSEENKTVTFGELKTPRRLRLTLEGSDGVAIDEDLFTNTWMKGDGSYLKRGTMIDDVLDGEALRFFPLLSNELSMTYEQPDTVDYVVGQNPGDYNINLLLKTMSTTTASFTVIDSQTRKGIESATIDVAQVLPGGSTGSRVLLNTDVDGKATGQVLATMSFITVTSPQYGSQSFSANLADSTVFRTVFAPAEGTTIRLNHTFQAAVADNATATVEQSYADGRNLEYTFTAKLPDGSDMQITDYIERFPEYILYSSLPQGTVLHVSATSTRDDVEPVEATATVDENNIANLTLPIVERGYIHVSYESSQGNKPAALLFNNRTGELLKKQAFGDNTFTDFTSLPAGEYLVAAMSKGLQYQGINNRSQLELYTLDKDYVAKTVTINQGHMAKISFASVPFTMTQLESNLDKRRASCTSEAKVGYYANIGITVTFEGLKEHFYGKEYDESEYPTNCRVEVYIPDGFTKLSAATSYRRYQPYGTSNYSILGAPVTIDEVTSSAYLPGDIYMMTATATWNSWQRKYVVEWPHIDQGGRMSISMIPTKAGTFIPEVYLYYTLRGKEYCEMLETNAMTISKSGIYVQEIAVKPSFIVCGTTQYFEEEENAPGGPKRASSLPVAIAPEPPYYHVTVMDDGQPIGKAQIKNDGTWEAQCQLNNPRRLSKHNIYAVIRPYKYNDISYKTETKTVTYDPDGVAPVWTKMSFFNHHPVHLTSTEVLFDHAKNKATPSAYGYSNEEDYNTDFTFEINLSNNDTTKVYAVALHIWGEGSDGGETITWAHFNKRKGHWIAYAKFNTRNIPNSVYVEPFYHKDDTGSAEDITDSYNTFEEFFKKNDNVATELLARFDQLIEQGHQASLQNNASLAPDPAELNKVILQLYGHLFGTDFEPGSPQTSDNTDELLQQFESIDNPLKNLDVIFQDVKKLNELQDLVKGITTSPATGLTAEGLIAQGYDVMHLDNGNAIYILCHEDGSWTYVDFAKDVKIDIAADAKLAPMMRMPRNASASEEWFWTAVEFIYLTAQDFVDLVGKISDACSAAIDAIEIYIKDCVNIQGRFIKQVQWNNVNLNWVERGFANLRLKFAYDSMTKTITAAQKLKDSLTKFKLGDGVGTLASLYSLITNYVKFRDQDVALWNLMKSLPDIKDCDDWEEIVSLQNKILGFLAYLLPYQTTTLLADVTALTTGLMSMKGLVVTGATSAWGVALSFGKIALSFAADKIYQQRYDDAYEVFQFLKSEIVCDHKKNCQERGDCPKCKDPNSCPPYPKKKKGPYPPTSEGEIDPSGFVYEGVESNRLEGATTTVFFKETVKNIFGEDEEKVTMWDAEKYGQINPQLTDANGEYGWMVPAGLWQVKYEKEGYRTEYSDWLPVPPPQLDVNQSMVQYSAPQVADVKATPQAVLVGFDKYMRGTTLKADGNITVTRDGQLVAGRVELDNAQGQTEQSMLAQKARFVPSTPLPLGKTLKLTVNGNVQSYAGVEMGNSFSQEFDIEQTVEQLVADSVVLVVYDQTETLTVQALPASVAAGKKVSVKILSDMIATADASELTLDSEGKAVLTLTGEANGTTAVVLQMVDDNSIQAVTVVKVRDEEGFICPMPEANYVDGIVVASGALVTLSCELPEAVIYYTLDGTCPCDSKTAMLYDGPITFSGDMILKAYAVAPGYADSEIAEYRYYLTSIIDTTIDKTVMLKKGVYDLQGRKLSDSILTKGRMKKGIYIINGEKVVVK